MKIFANGDIITLNENKPHAEAMVVNGQGQIVELGDKQELEKKYGKQLQKKVNLKEKTIIPGLNDSHLHLYQYALAKAKVNLSKASSIKEIKEITLDYIKENNIDDGKWIEGKGLNDENLANNQLPTKEDLDQITDSHPLIFKRVCYHVATVNSKALEICGIDKNTPDPEGGEIGHDNSGKPNGLLYDEAIDLVEAHIPQKDKEQIKELLTTAFKDMVKVGLTSIQVDDFFNVDNNNKILEAYQELEEENALPLRITLQMRLPGQGQIQEMADKGLTTGTGSNFLKIGPIKLMLDGSLGARTAALIEPYHDQPSTKGVLLYNQQEFNNLVKTAHQNEFQVAIHAIGDRAISTALNGFEQMTEDNSQPEARPVIVHAQICNEDIYKRMQEMGVVASIQPIFLTSDWDIIENRVGEERAKTSYAWKSMQEAGINLAGSSDAPIENPNPFPGIYAAVTRKDLEEKPANGWKSEENMNITEALELFTKGGAYQSFEEAQKGTLEKGKLADFVVLDEDITKIKPEKIKDIKPAATYIGGKKVFSK